MTKWLRSATSPRPSEPSSRTRSFLERISAKITPRATKILSVFLMIAAIKIGILAFMSLDMFLPDPPAPKVADGTVPSLRLPIQGPGTALAQQAPAAGQATPNQPAAGQPAPQAPGQPAPTRPAGTPDAQALLKRQDELDQREQALNALQADLNARVAKLKEMETNIKKMLDEAKGIRDQKLKHLIDVYSNMNAKQAAKVLETLDNGIAVKILAGMRGRQAGDVLNNMEAKKAAELTEMLTSLQIPGSNVPGMPQ